MLFYLLTKELDLRYTQIMNSELFYQIAITLLPNVGPVTIKKLLALCGPPEAIFKEKRSVLLKSQVPKKIIDALHNREVHRLATAELSFIEKHHLSTYFYDDATYPSRLKHCDDGPVMLYGKGKMLLNKPKFISIIGTRNASSLGIQFCKDFIAQLSNTTITVVSGLAYGIDICAHRSAVKEQLQTIGILAHGLNKIYPSIHRDTVLQMMEKGGVLTDFASHARFHPGNFPARNRIVAGLSDATVVIESASSGGSLITAEIANSYCREVFAIPGRTNDQFSKGCNLLIKQNKAALLESAEDLLNYLGWKQEKKPTINLIELNQPASKIVDLLKKQESVFVDELCNEAGLEPGTIANILLELELKGIVKNLPGSRYTLN